jgi:hypothetical protein
VGTGAALGAVPFAIGGPLGPLDALFESMRRASPPPAPPSSPTSTPSRALFLWRALTQWIGGIGIIVLFIADLPAARHRRPPAVLHRGARADRTASCRECAHGGAILSVYGLSRSPAPSATARRHDRLRGRRATP